MKLQIVVLCLSILLFHFINKANSSNSDLCGNLADVLAANQKRFDKAKSARDNVNRFCKNKSNPKQCATQTKKDFEQAYMALERSKGSYNAARCGG